MAASHFPEERKTHEERLAILETRTDTINNEVVGLRDFKHKYAQYPNLTEHFITQVNGFTTMVSDIIKTNAEAQGNLIKEHVALVNSVVRLEIGLNNVVKSLEETKDRSRWGIETVVSLGALLVAIATLWLKG